MNVYIIIVIICISSNYTSYNNIYFNFIYKRPFRSLNLFFDAFDGISGEAVKIYLSIEISGFEEP